MILGIGMRTATYPKVYDQSWSRGTHAQGKDTPSRGRQTPISQKGTKGSGCCSLFGLKNCDNLVQTVVEQINEFSDFQRQKPFIRINCVNSPFWQTRIAAILFAAFSVMSAVIFHADFSDQNQMIHFMKNVSIAGGFLFSLSMVPEPTQWTTG